MTDQPSIFAERPRPETLCYLVDLAREKSKEGVVTWRIGNIEDLGDNRRYFRFGKLTSRRSTAFQNGNFIEVSTPENPFTDVFLDADLGLLFIGHNPQLARRTEALAKQLVFLLRLVGGAVYDNTQYRIDPIIDADTFIEEINNAERVTGFSFTYSRPNPIDADRLIQRPLEDTLLALHAKSGKVTMNGDALDVQVVQDAAIALASSGESVSAQIRPKGSKRSVTRKLGNHPVVKDEDDRLRDKPGIIERLTRVYLNLRRRDDGGEQA